MRLKRYLSGHPRFALICSSLNAFSPALPFFSNFLILSNLTAVLAAHPESIWLNLGHPHGFQVTLRGCHWRPDRREATWSVCVSILYSYVLSLVLDTESPTRRIFLPCTGTAPITNSPLCTSQLPETTRKSPLPTVTVVACALLAVAVRVFITLGNKPPSPRRPLVSLSAWRRRSWV